MKLLIAIMTKDDRDEAERLLTDEGFMLTEMGSTGGFLKKKSVTLLIGTPADKVGRAKELLKRAAGRRSITVYQGGAASPDGIAHQSISVPVDTQVGGCTVFEIDATAMNKF